MLSARAGAGVRLMGTVQDVTDRAEAEARIRSLVITSYSIHYTKLYDISWPSSASSQLISSSWTIARSWESWIAPARRPLPSVITSYSIHYTKLYDLC